MPRAYGILGFVKFLKGYYVILVTGRKREAKIGQHSIYQVKKTEMVSLFMLTDNTNRDEENFYLNLFQSFDIPKECFYFSYTYDLTHSLQENIVRKVNNRMPTNRQSLGPGQRAESLDEQEAMSRPWESAFMWNKYHVEEFYSLIECKLWVVPFIHGFVSQANF